MDLKTSLQCYILYGTGSAAAAAAAATCAHALAHTCHCRYHKDYFHTVNAGISSMTFRIVTNPWGRIEALVAEQDVLTQAHE